ncbi:MAG: glycosyltransferase [Flavobacteriales bacterium]
MKELWLFTRQYPQGRGEAFLQHALPVWKARFERVRVIPMFSGEGATALPEDVELVELWPSDPHATINGMRMVARMHELLKVLRWHGPLGGRACREVLSHARQLLHKADVVQERLMPAYDPSSVALLSVWMEDWPVVLSILKDRIPGLGFTMMGHGWDLYEHRRASGTIPYRRSQMEAADTVLAVSERGAAHLKNSFPMFADKVRMVHLGTPDHGMGPLPGQPDLHVVSCSYLRPPKRVDLIAQALRSVERNVHWTHIGDGPGRGRIEELIRELPAHISVEMKGTIGNDELLSWYRTTPVDLFLHFSDSEGGVPLVLQEAASFGIPLMGNDAGGINEIVLPATGHLVPVAPTPEAIAHLIDAFPAQDRRQRYYREEVRNFWRKQFEDVRNFGRIADLF